MSERAEARDKLRAWMAARAIDDDDELRASRLIAAYVAACVREDRRKKTGRPREDDSPLGFWTTFIDDLFDRSP